MNVLLDSPRTVVCWAAESSVLDRCVTVLSDAGFDDVVACETESAVRQRATEDDVGCLVVHDSAGADAVVEVCRTLQSAESERPVVVLTDDVSLATEATVAGASATLHTPTDEQLRTVVADTVDAYVDRRTDTEEGRILDAMLDGLETPLYAKDTEGRHLKLADLQNDQDPADAIGKTDIELYGDESPAFARRAYEDDMTVIETESPVFNRDESHAEGGNRYWSRTTKVPWYGTDGEIEGLIGFSKTFSPKGREQVERKSRRLNDVETILGDRIEDELATVEAELAEVEGAGAATDALDRLDGIVDDLRSLIEQEESDVEPEAIDIDEVAQAAWEFVETGDATLDITFDDEPSVTADWVRVHHLLENLFRELCQGEDAARSVTITDAERGFAVESTATLVADGASEDLCFDALLADDEANTALNIVRGIAEKHGWTIDVSRGDDGGTRFEIDVS